jgi:protein-tyrosine phosphatase
MVVSYARFLEKPEMTAILFVCLGNICRSPLAEGIFRHQVQAARVADRFTIDSAGCGGWHSGELPDKRSIAVAQTHGIDISDQRARQIHLDDFDRFDLILGLDRDNVRHLAAMQPQGSRAKVALYLEEALGLAKNVPDPYYGGTADFEAVYQLCEKAGAGLLKALTNA